MEELIGSIKQTHSVPLKRTDSPEVQVAPISASLVISMQFSDWKKKLHGIKPLLI